MNWQDHITSNKGILLGKPTIKGTRLSVDHLVGLFAQGWTEDQVLNSYPPLNERKYSGRFCIYL